MWRLIDKDASKVVDIGGVNVHIKPLSGIKRAQFDMSLAAAFGKNVAGDFVGDMDVVARIAAGGIVKIEGYEDRDVVDVLLSMADGNLVLELCMAVRRYSGLTDDESKNSESSSGSPSSAGNAKEPSAEVAG